MDHVSLLQSVVVGIAGLFTPCALAALAVVHGKRWERPLVALHGHCLGADRTLAQNNGWTRSTRPASH
jgi:hypothetical protein